MLNMELGFVIDSPRLAAGLSGAIGSKRVFHTEPNASLWRRIQVFVLTLLPIDWLL